MKAPLGEQDSVRILYLRIKSSSKLSDGLAASFRYRVLNKQQTPPVQAGNVARYDRSAEEYSRAGAGEWLLEVEDLHVHFVTTRGVVRAVEGISYKVSPGETVALVGESGCGKSVSSLAIMRLLARPAGRVVAGRILFQGATFSISPEEEMRAIRGRDIAMIFQEPMTSLNPVLTIGFQIMEPLLIHLGDDARSRRARGRPSS